MKAEYPSQLDYSGVVVLLAIVVLGMFLSHKNVDISPIIYAWCTIIVPPLGLEPRSLG